jgi:hypothetical protein
MDGSEIYQLSSLLKREDFDLSELEKRIHSLRSLIQQQEARVIFSNYIFHSFAYSFLNCLY